MPLNNKKKEKNLGNEMNLMAKLKPDFATLNPSQW